MNILGSFREKKLIVNFTNHNLFAVILYLMFFFTFVPGNIFTNALPSKTDAVEDILDEVSDLHQNTYD